MDEDMSPMMPDPEEQRLLGLTYQQARLWWAAVVLKLPVVAANEEA
jgi:hypothetical protein